MADYSYLGIQNFDPTKYQSGLGNYTTRNTAEGRQEILDAMGAVLGTGYKSLDDSLADYAYSRGLTKHAATVATPERRGFGRNNPGSAAIAATPEQWAHEALRQPDQYDSDGGLMGLAGQGPLQKFNSEAELRAALDKAGALKLESKEKYGRQISDLQRWEELGQFVNDPNKKTITDWTYHRTLGGDKKDQKITGENALYGSTPVFYDGKLIGYEVDTAPADGIQKTYQNYLNPLAMGSADTEGNTQSSGYLWRENNPELQSVLRDTGKEGYGYVPIDQIDKLGWTNKDTSSYSHQKSGIIDKLGPAALALNLIPGVGTALYAGAQAANAAYHGDMKGALINAAGAYLGMPGNSVMGSATNALKGMGMSGAAANAVAQGGLGGLRSAATGGNFAKGALSSGLGSYAGQYIGGQDFGGKNSFMDQAATKLAGGLPGNIINKQLPFGLSSALRGNTGRPTGQSAGWPQAQAGQQPTGQTMQFNYRQPQPQQQPMGGYAPQVNPGQNQNFLVQALRTPQQPQQQQPQQPNFFT